MIFNQGYSIRIDRNRCLNQWHQSVECSHCVSNCPADAIFIYQDKIYLNKELCNGCALCLSDCPTQVFSSEQWDETSIVEDVQAEEWKITEFFCAKHTTPYKQHKSKDRDAVRLPACLSSISKGTWYELGLKTEIELHLEECEQCPMAETLPRLEYNLATAAEWIAASGQSAQLRYIKHSTKGKTKKSMFAIETGLKVTSRRDLFLSILGKGREIIGYENERSNAPSEETGSEQGNYDRCLPDWHKRLAKIFPPNQVNVASPAYWPTIKINTTCVNCGMCSRFCPSGTLQIDIKNEMCTHYYTSGLCLDCRLCQLFCPQEAISRDREKVENPFELLSIYTVSVDKCKRCENLTSNKSRCYCYWCEEESAIDGELKENSKKLLLG